MARKLQRFQRLEKGTAGGAKIASRRDVNLKLTPLEAMNEDNFLKLLCNRFGKPDNYADAAYSYSIRDTKLGVDFEVYSAQSGPAYGGRPPDHFVDFGANDNRVKPEVLQALVDFELLGNDKAICHQTMRPGIKT